jgi:tRNA pseudouridine55 synthase
MLLEEGNVFLVDKPFRWTSFDVVKKIKYLFQLKKIGHAGTLDPLATGLLILCSGKLTKTIDQFQSMNKVYTGTMMLGKTTPSYDLETPFDTEKNIDFISLAALKDASERLTGQIEQVPPAYSAIKVDGKRSFNKARKGEFLELKARPVVLYSFEIIDVKLPEVNFKVKCSKGTYIRSLVHDYGKILECGATLTALRRNSIGPHQVDDAKSIEEYIQLAKEIASGNENSL